MVPEEVITSTVSISLMSMTEVHLCVPFSKNNNLGKNMVSRNHQRPTLLGGVGEGML